MDTKKASSFGSLIVVLCRNLSPSQRKPQRPHSSNVTACAQHETVSSGLAAQLLLTLSLGVDPYYKVIAKQLCNKRTNFYWEDLAKPQQWVRWKLDQSARTKIHVYASHDSIFSTHYLCNQWVLSFVWLFFKALICTYDSCSFKRNKSDLTWTTSECVRVEVCFIFWLCSVTQLFCSTLLPPVYKRKREKGIKLTLREE